MCDLCRYTNNNGRWYPQAHNKPNRKKKKKSENCVWCGAVWCIIFVVGGTNHIEPKRSHDIVFTFNENKCWMVHSLHSFRPNSTIFVAAVHHTQNSHRHDSMHSTVQTNLMIQRWLCGKNSWFLTCVSAFVCICVCVCLDSFMSCPILCVVIVGKTWIVFAQTDLQWFHLLSFRFNHAWVVFGCFVVYTTSLLLLPLWIHSVPLNILKWNAHPGWMHEMPRLSQKWHARIPLK